MICAKCRKEKPGVVNYGEGLICPSCQEAKTYVTKYEAVFCLTRDKKATQVKYKGKLLHVYGESLADLWGNAGKMAATFGYKMFKDSCWWMKQEDHDKKDNYLWLRMNKKFLTVSYLEKEIK